MPDESPPVFVLTVQAVAGPRNSVPDGRRYDLLVFARGREEIEADAVARKALADLGWDEPAIRRTGEITDPSGIPPDLERAYANAAAHGCAVIVYDEP
ncbi:hypothetical protein [Phenylobacterium sp.]|jgi:hypothetical protein|uniref:hypothetical protein n=1 Tax=Phenylobacterium sp. TaxID=1871053 RepID=UPI002F93FAE6